MKIIRTLSVTEDEFYTYIEQQFCNDYAHATGHRIELDQITPGIQYEQKIKKSTRVNRITVRQFQRGKIWEVAIDSPLDSVSVKYETRPDANESTEVTLTEEIATYQADRQIKPVRWLSQIILLGKMSRTLMDMGDSIIHQRFTE